jgi:hypothetical protein
MRPALTVPALCAALVLSLATLSHADSGKDKDKEKSKGKGHGEAAAHDDAVVVFRDRDREVVRSYWVETYGRDKCPPGLAKKGNGCLPPGQAKKRYVVGHPLPAVVVVQPLPPVLVTRLGPAPAGYEYVIVDGDIVKLAVGTRLVVDAISALLH